MTYIEESTKQARLIRAKSLAREFRLKECPECGVRWITALKESGDGVMRGIDLIHCVCGAGMTLTDRSEIICCLEKA